MSLLYSIQQLSIYGGLVLFIAGILGNGINIFIFSSVRTYRRTPSSFYFLVGSINNILYILINLIIYIIDIVYRNDNDLYNYSIIWCKIRSFSGTSLISISLTCSCLATIDQFLITSRGVHLRGYSNIKRSHQIMFVIIIVFCLHGIPAVLYANIIPSENTCTLSNIIYQIYASMYIIIVLSVIPVLITTIFGCLTYRNIRQIILLAEQNADSQLVTMTLFQVVLVLISIVPYGVYYTYILLTSGVTKSIDQRLKEYIVSIITNLTSYLYFVGNFYMFLISSSRFRKTVKERLLWWRRRNAIHAT